MADIRSVAEKVDQAIIKSRLNSLASMMMTDRTERLERIAASLTKLSPGAYLIGTGPSTVGIIPLTVDEIVLGRSATPLEEPAEGVVDYEVCDAMYLGPHEVSRIHAKIVRHEGSEAKYWLIDLRSRCGTLLNGEVIDTDQFGQILSHGDIISLGSSQVSTYVFIHI